MGGSSCLFQNKPYKAYDVVMPTDLLTVAARPVAPPARKRQRFDEDLSNPASSRLSFVPKSVISTGGHATPITLSATLTAPLTVPPTSPLTAPLTAPLTVPLTVPLTAPLTLPTAPLMAPPTAPLMAPLMVPPMTPVTHSPSSHAADDQCHPMTLVWEPYPTTDATASLPWDPQECHQIVSQAFPNPQYCVACFLLDQLIVRHLDQAQRRLACPLYSLDYQAWQAFQLGWQLMQKKGVAAFRQDMVDIERYVYCGSCLIEICHVAKHGCVFAGHD